MGRGPILHIHGVGSKLSNLPTSLLLNLPLLPGPLRNCGIGGVDSLGCGHPEGHKASLCLAPVVFNLLTHSLTQSMWGCYPLKSQAPSGQCSSPQAPGGPNQSQPGLTRPITCGFHFPEEKTALSQGVPAGMLGTGTTWRSRMAPAPDRF